MKKYQIYATTYMGIWDADVIDGDYGKGPSFTVYETDDPHEALRQFKAVTTNKDALMCGEGKMNTISALYLHFNYPWADGIYLDFVLDGQEATEQYWMDEEATSYECMYLNKED